MAQKRSLRAMSLSLDWDSIVKDVDEVRESKQHLAGTVSYDKETVKFCTGSEYTGKWNQLGMAVYGYYCYPHGCEYEGGFEDGMFHGEGTLLYPMGQKLEGLWEKGKMIAYKFSNVDGLDYDDDWGYCTMPDRRFNISIREGLQPAGREFMTNQQPERPIEPGMYDTGDGFYDPSTKSIIRARDPEEYAHLAEEETVVVEKTEDDFWVNAVTMVSDDRHKWIVEHCRKGWDEPAGYRPDLYEDWITGRKSELEELEKKYAREDSLSEDSNAEPEQRYSESLENDSETKVSVDYAGTGRKLTLETSKTSLKLR